VEHGSRPLIFLLFLGGFFLTRALKEIVEKAIEEYNKYRAPEASASLVSIDGEEGAVLFEGELLLHMRLLRLYR